MQNKVTLIYFDIDTTEKFNTEYAIIYTKKDINSIGTWLYNNFNTDEKAKSLIDSFSTDDFEDIMVKAVGKTNDWLDLVNNNSVVVFQYNKINNGWCVWDDNIWKLVSNYTV